LALPWQPLSIISPFMFLVKKCYVNAIDQELQIIRQHKKGSAGSSIIKSNFTNNNYIIIVKNNHIFGQV
jgi:hypothetical protein